VCAFIEVSVAGLVFDDAHKNRVCVRVFIGVSVCVVLCNSYKKKTQKVKNSS
jgi:hypothetical protein